MLLDHCLAEKADRLDVLDRAVRDLHRHEALGGVEEGEQRLLRDRQRPEVAGQAVGHPLHLLALEVVAEDVRDAGVVGGAVEVAAVGRVDEVGRRVVGELVQHLEPAVAGQERFDRHAHQALAAADLDQRAGHPAPVRRHVDIEQVAAERQLQDLLEKLPGVPRRLDADQP